MCCGPKKHLSVLAGLLIVGVDLLEVPTLHSKHLEGPAQPGTVDRTIGAGIQHSHLHTGEGKGDTSRFPTRCPTTKGGMQSGSSVGTCALCRTRFRTFRCRFACPSRCSLSEISASELRRKLAQTALLVGYLLRHLLSDDPSGCAQNFCRLPGMTRCDRRDASGWSPPASQVG